MKTILLFVCATIGASMAETITFDATAAGTLPAGWTLAMTHKGGAPKWEVVADDSAPSKQNVLAQAIYDKANIKVGSVAVKFKAISRSADQAAGLVWRYQDPENYYIVRANALENNIVLYRVEKGERIALAPKGTPSKTYGVKHRVPKLTWNKLGVSFQGSVFSVSFDGEKLFEVKDSTFTGSGKVGLWTKADSVTYCDNLEITEGSK